jgi:hypothetical protein
MGREWVKTVKRFPYVLRCPVDWIAAKMVELPSQGLAAAVPRFQKKSRFCSDFASSTPYNAAKTTPTPRRLPAQNNSQKRFERGRSQQGGQGPGRFEKSGNNSRRLVS